MLDEPEQRFAPSTDRSDRSVAPRRSASRSPQNSRHDYGDDFAGDYNDAPAEREGGPRQRSLKLKLNTRIPKSLAGRIATAVALLVILGMGVGLLMVTRSFLLHDSRFMIASRAAIEIQGNQHLTRGQLLDIFGEDVDRNIFRISLADRQAQLEQLPWVAHATVMRLLPGRIRVSVAERTPVAFVRQGSHIGLVDDHGILLDMVPSGTPAQTEPHYSFPVVTGLSAGDPASTRDARMRIYERFTADLDSSGEKISEALSEVDLSNPEDVKALIPANSSEILVHFGDDHFLERYRRFQEHLPAWHTQYPNLASVDMRYEREVVLDMAAAAAVKTEDTPASKGVAAKVAAEARPSTPAAHGAVRHLLLKPPVKAKPHLVKPVAHKSLKPVKNAAAPPVQPATVHPASGAAQPSASAAARSGFLAKPTAGKPLTTVVDHPPQVPSR